MSLDLALGIARSGLAAVQRAPTTIDPSLSRRSLPTTPVGQPAPVPGAVNPGQVPLADDPLAGAAQAVGNVTGPTPPGNRLPTPEINRPTTPVPGATRTNPAPAPAGEAREVRPPIIDPAVTTGAGDAVPPAAPKQ